KVTLLATLGFISAGANGFVPYITGRFFDALIGVSQHKVDMFSSSLPFWIVLLGGWVLTQLVANNIDWVMDRTRRKLANDMHFRLQTDGFVHMLRLPMSYHKSIHSNGELQKIGQAGWRVSAILGSVTS